MCQPTCTEAVECCGPPDELPPGIECPGEFPFNFICDDGFCDLAPCTGDAECQAVSPQAICVAVDGVNRCVGGCESDDECAPTQSCSGSSDGRMYCESSSNGDPYACDEDEQCEATGWGRCIDGRCGCTDDADCPADAGCPPG